MSGAGAGAAEAGTITRVTLPCEIRIVNEERREIELCATSEAVDSYGTVFGYEASRAAFERWIGNVREMHERKAVGTRVALRADDSARKIYVRVRISKGAPDTWEKVKDNTLRGASIGASNVVWAMQQRGADQVPVATAYDLVELSLVDNPSNPDALGVTFVRDAAPTDTLTELEEPERAQAPDPEIATPAPAPAAGDAAGPSAASAPAPAPAPEAGAGPGPGHIIEDAGSLSVDDMATRIAADALARGRAAVLAGVSASAGAAVQAEPTPKQRRLAVLGAPGYVEHQRAAGSGNEPGASFDGDGDHDGNVPSGSGGASDLETLVTIASGPTEAAVMAPSPAGSVAHMAHAHHHTGRYDDPSNHRESSSPHMHLDGTSHVHDQLMAHDHGGHEGVPGGHSHPHVHVPDHSHFYRVADGSPIDARLVSAEHVRTFEYVSDASFRAAGGAPGQALSADQMRFAMAAELAAIRSLGPYSRNPDGPADAGTPADAAPGVASTDEHVESGHVSAGVVNTLDRDGNPQEVVAEATTGTLDVSQEADGWTGRSVSASGSPSAVAAAAVAREVTRGVVAEVERLVGPLGSRLSTLVGDFEQRLVKIEAQPMPGGPQLRAADKVTALTPSGETGTAGPGEQLRALEALAGRLSDPQAQIAVAAEMIRLGQEARGMSPALQVMPRAGTGVGPVR